MTVLLPAEATEPTNWALARETFPKMIKVMTLAPYHEAVVSGLVLSVGGLTEAVVKSSSSALLEWARAANQSKELDCLRQLAYSLAAMVSEPSTYSILSCSAACHLQK